MRRKLLQVITEAGHGGAQSHVETLIRCARQDYEVHLAYGGEGALAAFATELGCEVHRVQALLQPIVPAADARAVWALREIIRQVRPDIVHAHSSKAGFVGRIAARMEDVPAVFTAHGWAFADGVSIQRKLVAIPAEWAASKVSARIVTVSQHDADIALRYRVCRKDQIEVIRNGIPDLSRVVDSADDGGPVNMVMVARFAPQKDHDTLLMALRRLPESLRWKMSLIGDGTTRLNMEARAREYGVEDRVVFMGSRNDVPRQLADASIFVLASRYEGFPISIVEAMRAGLPVIATDVGGVREAVEDRRTGLLVAPGSVDDLTQGLVALLSSRERRREYGRAGRERYVREFTSEMMWRRLADLYRRIGSGVARH